MLHDPKPSAGLSRRAALAGLGAGGLGLAVGARSATAATPGLSTSGHPLVGTWFLTVSSTNPTDADDLFSLHADGTYLEANADGSVRLGVWEPTSPTTATLTITAYSRDAAGASAGGITLRLAITLNPDGNSYVAEGTIELTAPDGSKSGQAGPVRGDAKRMLVEAPGTPVMSPEELFRGTAGAPAATPAT
jgi:hypothetical protein